MKTSAPHGARGAVARTRSTKGCWTCREKKVKCDERRPVCERCSRLDLPCDYAARPRKPYKARKKASPSSQDKINESASSDRLPGRSVRSSSHENPQLQSGVSLDSDSLAREAVQYYRTQFTPLWHSKDSRYNLLGMIHELATKSDLVMHMVIAISRAAMLLEQAGPESQTREDELAIGHYSTALRQLAVYTDSADHDRGLDDILATIYLMLLYEQKFGDHHGNGLSDHLKGLASIIQRKTERCHMLHMEKDYHDPSSVKVAEMMPGDAENGSMSLLSVRTLEWICVLDAGAASFNLGGDFNAAVHTILEQECRARGTDDARGLSGFLQRFAAMQSYTNQLPCRFWGNSYPIAEFADDISTNELYLLYGSCVQLRYLISSPASASPQPAHSHEYHADISSVFCQVYEQYTQYFLLAQRLDTSTNNSTRIVRDLRFIIPHYYAAYLLFLHTTAPNTPNSIHQHQKSLTTIAQLALQAFQHEGDSAMLRIAWPLFILTLSTPDPFYRSWSSCRLHALSKYGRNYARAGAFASTFVDDQQRATSGSLDPWVLLSIGTHGKFAI